MISRTGRRRVRRARRPAPFTLADSFRAWIAENAARGVDRESMTATLVEGGVPARLVIQEIDAVLGSPAMPGCLRLSRRVERLELVLRLLRTMADQAPRPAEVERRRGITVDELYSHYYARSRPVVLEGFLEGWPALAKWTPEHLAERFGDVPIEIVAGREGNPGWDRQFRRHVRTVTLAEYVKMVRAAGRSDDIYLVSNNRALERPELRPLLDDLTPPPDMFAASRPGAASLWLGPEGTFTPLHHDTTNILFCQVYGRKRIDLVSPLATSLLDGARGFYADVRAADLRENPREDARVLGVELGPGDALFLPAGWWHEVTALEVSIHVSLLTFRRPNEVGWYRPGDLPGA